jgi:hypothetical protein
MALLTIRNVPSISRRHRWEKGRPIAVAEREVARVTDSQLQKGGVLGGNVRELVDELPER